jgi:hypothetical protein
MRVQREQRQADPELAGQPDDRAAGPG